MLASLTTLLALAMITAGLAPASSLAAPPPQVNSLSPIGGPDAGGTSVVIHGTRLSGATIVKFGSVNAAGFTIKSGNVVTAVSPAGTGTVDVTVTTPEGTSATSSADLFSYGPTVTGVAPDRGPASGGTSVSVTGSDLSGAEAVKFGAAKAASFKAESEGKITAVSPEGSGTVDVTVVTSEGASATSAADQFSFVPAPIVTSVSPPAGPEAGGTEVTIAGANFNEVEAVDFGMSPAFFSVGDAGSITAFSPAGVGDVDVTVTGLGGTSATSPADRFSYVPAPSVTALSPDTGPATGGTAVTIEGSNLDEATAVSFGSSGASSFVVDSADSITAVSPPGAPDESVDVTVTTQGGTTPTSPADRFRYLQNEPLLVSRVSPDSGPRVGGVRVRITGKAFAGATAVDFGSVSATSFTVKSQHRMTAIVPPGTGTVDLTVTTPEGTSPTSSRDLFNYTTLQPTVEKVTPAEAREKGGSEIHIKGANLAGATEVHFGSAAATSFVVNEKGTAVTAVDPPAEVADSATVDVTVTTPEGTSAISPADRFSYKLSPPIVRHLSVHKGPAAGGTIVDIAGENFIAVTAVDFGSVSASSFTVNSGGSITATSPPGEGVGQVAVTVTTPRGVSGPGECTFYGEEGPETRPCPPHELFTFVEPTVTGVSPSTGSPAGGTEVTVTGTGFDVGTTAMAFGFGKTALATSVDCTSSTTCTMVAPAHVAGTVSVRANAVGPGGASHSNPPADQFTYG